MRHDDLSQDRSDAIRAERHRMNAISSQLLLRRLRKFHYEYAPESYKDKFLPSLIVGNPLVNYILGIVAPKLADNDVKPDDQYIGSHPDCVTTILSAVSSYYHIPIAELIGQRRTGKIVRARQVAMYLAHIHTTSSVAGIGRALNRDHSTILHGKKLVEKSIKNDQTLALQVAIIQQQVLTLNRTPTEAMVKAARERLQSHFVRWGRDREVLLVRLVNAGLGWAEIGRELGISGSSAFGKYHRLTQAADVFQIGLQG